jgi:hypothetical protein
MNDPDMRSQEVLLRAEQLPHALYLTIALTWGVVMRFLQWPLIPETLSTWPLVIVLVITHRFGPTVQVPLSCRSILSSDWWPRAG